MGEAVVETPIALGMLVALIVCFALQNIWKATFGPFLHWLAGIGITAGHGVFRIDVHPFRFAEQLNEGVQKFLTQGVAMAEKRFVQALTLVVEPFLLIAGVTLALGLAADEGFKALWHHVTSVTPRVIHQTIVRPVERAVKATAGISRATYNVLAHKVTALTARVEHLARATAGTIAQPFPRIGNLEREAASAAKWLRKHRYLAGFGTLAALGVGILSKLGLGFLRCANFKKAGKRACGMDTSLLDALIADTLLIAGTLSLVEFAREMETVMEEVAPLVTRFWRDT